MKTIELTCAVCSKTFIKPLKEYTRRMKHGFNVFLCSRSCTGRRNSKNLLKYIETLGEGYLRSPENIERLRKANIIATDVITKYTKEEKPFADMIRKARQRCKGDVTITIDYLQQVWTSQAGRCALTGIPITLDKNADKNHVASLDRIDSRQGYVFGNVQFVSYPINLAKGNRSDEDVKRLIRLIVCAQTVQCLSTEKIVRGHFSINT